MSTITVELPYPESLRELGYTPDEIRREVPILLVLKRYRQGTISSGKAASVLGLTRREFLDLLAREGVSLYEPSDAELAVELKATQTGTP